MQPRVIKRATAVPMLPQLVGIGRTSDAVAAIAPTPILSTSSSATAVPFGARKVRLMAVGGGGGSRNGSNLSSGGASGGSNASGVYDITPDLWGTTISWTVGAAGSPGAAGGTTTISWPAAKLTLTGPGGVTPSTSAGAVGVPASGGQVNNTGKTGSAGGSGNDGGGGGAAGGLEFAAGGNGANGNTAAANVLAGGGGGVGAYGGWTVYPSMSPTIQAANPPDAGVRGPGNQGVCFAQNVWVNTSADGGWGGGGAGHYTGGGAPLTSGYGGVYIQFTS